MTVHLEASKHRGHVTVHSDDDTHGLIRPFRKTYDNLRSIDGIDELASLVGQLLPKLGQAIVSVGILVPATPFVAIGAAGAISESREQFKEVYPDLLLGVLRKREAIFSQLRRDGVSEQDIAETEKMLNKAIGFLEQDGSPSLRYEIEQYRRAEKERPVALADRNATVLSATGMTLMTAGMLQLIGQGVAGIVEHSAGTLSATGTGAAAVGSALGTMAAGVFLPAQIAMAGHGATKFTTGLLREDALKQDAKALDKLKKNAEHGPALPKKAMTSVQQLIDAKRKLNFHHSIGYGATTAVGQSLMAGASVAALTGVGAPLAIPLAAAGAPLTMIGAGARILHLNKEKKLLGSEASQRAKDQTLHLQEIIDLEGLAAATSRSAWFVQKNQKLIARSKLHSLAQKCLNEEVKSGKTLTPLERLHKVSDMALAIEKRLFNGTGLLKSDMHELRLSLRDYHAEGFFMGTAEDVQLSLNGKVLQDMVASEIPVSKKTLQKTLKNSARKFLKSKDLSAGSREALSLEKNEQRQFSIEQLIGIAGHDAKAAEIFSREYSTNMAAQIKTDSKYLRNDAAEKLITTAHTVTGRPDTYKDKDGHKITRL